MKFTILIDQRAIAERFPKLNLKDAALLSYLGDAFNSPRMRRFTHEGQQYVWIKASNIREQMPLLGLKDDKAVSARLRILRKAELLETVIIDGKFACHRPGIRWDEMTGIEPEIDSDFVPNPPPSPNPVGEPPRLQSDTPPDSSRGAVYKGVDHKEVSHKGDKNPPAPQGGMIETGDQKSKAAKPDKRAHESIDLWPDEFRASEAFTAALADYFQVRREKRSGATPRATELLRSKLTKHPVELATAALQKSAENGWTGVFPESVNNGIKRPAQQGQAEADNLNLW